MSVASVKTSRPLPTGLTSPAELSHGQERRKVPGLPVPAPHDSAPPSCLQPALLLHLWVNRSCWSEAGQEPRRFLYMGKKENKVISSELWKPPRTPKPFLLSIVLMESQRDCWPPNAMMTIFPRP